MSLIYRIKDIFFASFLLLLISPLFLGICVLLYATQKKVFFIQKRPGKNEKLFRLIKFSTLRDIRVGEEEGKNDRDRETLLGTYLRKYSLDELPQLLNILYGDMTFIGPRPLLTDYLSLYTPAERKRHLVKPGLTGWAQIHGRNSLTFKERFAYDIWYVAHKSLLLDVRILVKTIPILFTPSLVYTDMHSTSPKFNGTN